MAHGFYTPPNIHYDPVKGYGRPFHYYTYGACLIEATVDCLRGTYTLDASRIVHDLGRTIIPTVDRGQIEGGLAQGIGWVTLEELAFDTDGRITSQALSTYKAPDAEFMPDEMVLKVLEDVENPGVRLGVRPSASRRSCMGLRPSLRFGGRLPRLAICIKVKQLCAVR